ncbi:MAG: YjbQ family protein [Dehalococcoidales bacterium]|nr:YjbQ family protein [Dehalococcoidales bacterium]
MIINKTIHVSTRGHGDIIDITGQVNGEVENTGLKNGTITVFVVGSTAGLTTIEYESGLIADFQAMWERLAPQNIRYEHNERWHDGNGYAHVRASLLGSSLTIPLVERRLTLGTWQQIILVDFDNRSREREIVVQIIGE